MISLIFIGTPIHKCLVVMLKQYFSISLEFKNDSNDLYLTGLPILLEGRFLDKVFHSHHGKNEVVLLKIVSALRLQPTSIVFAYILTKTSH
jgi:hypothetical protein